MWLYSLVCVEPGRTPQRQVFSRRDSLLPGLDVDSTSCTFDMAVSFIIVSRVFTLPSTDAVPSTNTLLRAVVAMLPWMSCDITRSLARCVSRPSQNGCVTRPGQPILKITLNCENWEIHQTVVKLFSFPSPFFFLILTL